MEYSPFKHRIPIMTQYQTSETTAVVSKNNNEAE